MTTPTRKPLDLAPIKAGIIDMKEGPWNWAAADVSMTCLGTKDDEDGMGWVLAVTRCESCQKRTPPNNCFHPDDKHAAFIRDSRVNIPALIAEVEALRAALKPFAELGDGYPDGVDYGDSMMVNIADLKRAASLLPEEPA